MLDITANRNQKNMEVTQHPKTLENIVKDTMYKIPIYQREYSLGIGAGFRFIL